MFLTNALYLDEQFRLVKGTIQVEDSRIAAVGEHLSWGEQDLAVDCEGYTIVPGFVDVHIHGCAGSDTCDGSREAIDAMARYLLSCGVTSFCPTTMTVDSDTIDRALLAAKDCYEHPCEDGARVVGVNMEGPFISPKKKGAQLEEAIQTPDYERFARWVELSGGIVRLIALAPEMPGAKEFIPRAAKLAHVSIAHTAADYDGAKESFDLGIDHATHLFNAMTGLSHRSPGVVGAVFDDQRVFAELICDGNHIHPAVLRTAFRLLGERALVISDAMRMSGLPEGDCGELGGQRVTVKDGVATLEDGTLAGSVTNLHQELKNMVSFGIPLPQAARAMSLTPAKSIGLDGEIGSIAPGKRADLVVLDENLDIAAVYH